jgi:IS4 transposase
MSDDPRIIELLSEMLLEQRAMHEEQRETNRRLGSMDQRLASLERQQEITNIKQDVVIDELGRLRKAMVQLAEGSSVSFEKLSDHEQRIKILEARL